MGPFTEAEFGTLVRKSGVMGKEVNTARRHGAPDSLECAPHYIDNENVRTDAVVVPVYGYKHSGPVVYKASKRGDPFLHVSYGFDSGLAGIVFVSGYRVKQLTTRKKNPYTVQQIEARLIELVQEQSDYETDGAKYWFDCTVDEILEAGM